MGIVKGIILLTVVLIIREKKVLRKVGATRLEGDLYKARKTAQVWIVAAYDTCITFIKDQIEKMVVMANRKRNTHSKFPQEEVLLFSASYKKRSKKKNSILSEQIRQLSVLLKNMRKGFVKAIFIAGGAPKQFVIFSFSTLKKIPHVFQFPHIHLKNPFHRRFFRRRRKKEKARYKPSFFYKLKFFVLGVIVSGIFIFLPILGFFFISDLPNPHNLSVNYIPKTTKIYDRSGNLLYEIYANQNRTIVKLSDIPKALKDATVAIEDKNFYSHPGFDLQGITRAFISDIKKKDLQGGSTITQQLIKSAFLNPAPNIIRKVREVVLAFWAERIFSKNQILELYFNYVPYGGTAWGVQAASEVYFGKRVSDLDLAESAFLAGLPRAPSIYSPYSTTSTTWKRRQKDVLDAMVRLSKISRFQAEEAYKKELVFQSPQIPIRAPHFVMYIRDLLTKEFGLSEVERGGLQVTTSLSLPLQEEVQKIVSQEVSDDAYLNIQNGASLITNPSNGDILAMIGSRDYFDHEHDGNVNVAVSRRQPGSTIKIVTYSLALSSGFTESTILEDTPLTISNQWETYSPVNYDGAYHGRLPLRLAFANSFNIPAVRVAQGLGAENILHFGQAMGVSSWENLKNYGISITLGGSEVTMIDLATTFGTIANAGKRVDLDPILEVKDSYGKIIYKKAVKPEPVVNPGVAFIISDILADNNARSMEFGPNSPLNIPGHRVSVKTGTTDNKRDNWTVGFTSSYVVSTWVGNNDNSPMSPTLASGITGAAPMWNKIMTLLLKDKKESNLQIPENVLKKLCNGREAFFIRGTENSVSCNYIPSPTPKTQ